jgi:hypothetical protein
MSEFVSNSHIIVLLETHEVNRVESGTQLVHPWRGFFIPLEQLHGLDPDSPQHLWLLHYLFLDDITAIGSTEGVNKKIPYEMFLKNSSDLDHLSTDLNET